MTCRMSNKEHRKMDLRFQNFLMEITKVSRMQPRERYLFPS
jgi:hypothetical protein